MAPAETLSTADWDRTMRINLRAPFLCARSVAPMMLRQKWGRIITISSQAAVIGIEHHVAYSASKAGLLGMTNCLALEWGPSGVTANCVSPTIVETELEMKVWADEKSDRARAEIPTRRFAQPMAARVVHAGTLPIQMLGWRLHTKGAGAGALLHLLVHDTDLLRFILGQEPLRVATVTQNGGLAIEGIEDAAMSLIQFSGNVIAQVHDSFTTRAQPHLLRGGVSARRGEPARPGRQARRERHPLHL